MDPLKVHQAFVFETFATVLLLVLVFFCQTGLYSRYNSVPADVVFVFDLTRDYKTLPERILLKETPSRLDFNVRLLPSCTGLSLLPLAAHCWGQQCRGSLAYTNREMLIVNTLGGCRLEGVLRFFHAGTRLQ